jgi:MFS transporter, FSR family, fosmidomycin resistance protein
MTHTADRPIAIQRTADIQMIASVCAAHFVSHFYFLVLPPLFIFIRNDYGVSFTELSLALTAFNTVSAVLQTPAGFLVDRIDARLTLIAGLLIQAFACVIIASIDSYWVLIAMFALIGLGNTVYHPANYSLLSHRISPERISQAYSVHSFSGMLGSAATPVTVLLMHNYFGWRGAFFGAAIIGAAVAAVLFLQRDGNPAPKMNKSKPEMAAQTSWQLLLSRPILMSVLFFMLIAAANGGLQNYSVVALGALYGTSPIAANTALSANLVFSATGVLLGGWIAGRTIRHGLVTGIALTVSALTVILLGLIDPHTFLLLVMMSLAGLCSGIVMPSRDMLVRSITPPGAFGKVFGFVTNGYNIAGIVAPLIFGALMDRGDPRSVFLLIAAFSSLAVLTIASTRFKSIAA